MEKERLVDFIATIMEDSGFKIKKNYQVANQVIDIYGILDTNVGNVGVVVACKNYEEPWKTGLDVLKDMENAARATKSSKIIIFTTSSFTHGAAVYAQKRNMKLVDRKGLMKIAQNYASKRTVVTEPIIDEDDYDYVNTKPASLNPRGSSSSRRSFSGRKPNLNNRNTGNNYQYNTSVTSKPRNYLKTSSRSVQNNLPNLNGVLDFFTNHHMVYLIVLLIIASLVSYLFNIITLGPWTGLGKIVTSAIICFGGLLLVDRNLSDVLFNGFIIFFISIIISIVVLTV
ncbi:restriction endonuclease [Methanosphaera sp.]